ncbi:unnamed protein product [Malus baccata var. baccata]
MTSHEYDSDIVQWGIRLFGRDPVCNSSYYYGDMIQRDSNDIDHEECIRSHYDTESNNVENDEIIAHTLQEEFSRLSVREASEYSHAGEVQSQASFLADEWHGQSTRDYYSDHGYGQEEADTVAPSSLCSRPDDHLELTDGCALDGEVGWGWNPVPHIPRINGEIPSIDEATSDHQRLVDRLQLYGFVEHKVAGDGNCQFHALSDQLYQSPDNHEYVRKQVVNQLKSHPEIYEGYVPMAYDDYLEKMSKDGEWGDHVSLQAAADSYEVKIFVLTSFKDNCCIEILPNIQTSKQVIYLSFWAEVHYNSIYPQGGTPSYENRKKKKWRIFGNKH